jgi:hypothetical protein
MIEDAAKKQGMNMTSFNSYFVSKIETEVTCLLDVLKLCDAYVA